MLQNYDTVVWGTKVVLVPYREEHVQRYHEWMCDPALQEATASEPLTLEQEYAMQKSWAQDGDKCTFILLDRERLEAPSGSVGAQQLRAEHQQSLRLLPMEQIISAMAGDVNLFFNDYEDKHTAEIEVMVAEQGSRRKGVALQALKIFMAYAFGALHVHKFRAKIGIQNTPSLQLFQKLGYRIVSTSAVFSEHTLELAVEEGVRQELQETHQQLQLTQYSISNTEPQNIIDC